MNKTYQDNLTTERTGAQVISDYLEMKTGNRPIEIVDEHQQKWLGDIVTISKSGTTSIELKIEERFTGNLFVELWSNREWGRPGWLFTSEAQVIAFYFKDQDHMVGVELKSLKHWLLNQRDGKLDNYKQVKAKQTGPNDTFGAIVPISDLRAAHLRKWWEAHPRQELSQQQPSKDAK